MRVKSIKNELMTMITAKKTGYFKSGPTITGTAEITETLSVTSNRCFRRKLAPISERGVACG